MSDEKREDLEAVRTEKLAKIEALGLDPWGQRFPDHRAIADVRTLPAAEAGSTEPGPAVRIAGRILLRRDMGRVHFLTVRDWTGEIQVFLGKKQVGDLGWQLANLLDLADLVGVDGT